MNTERFTTVAAQLIEGFDSGAHQVIAAYRQGGERLAEAAKARWDAALEESSPQLSAETRRNAGKAQQAFGRCYGRGIELSAAGAEVAVGTLVQAARAALQRADAWQRSRA